MTQDEQGIREKIAEILVRWKADIARMIENPSEFYAASPMQKTNQILSQTVSRGGGVCPECLGQKRLSDKQGMKADCSYGFIDWCLACNGTGQKQPKTLGEIIKGWEDETEE